MILTCKALTDFEKYLDGGNHTPWIAFFYNLPETVQLAYYQEWFDSVGIYIIIMPYVSNGYIEDAMNVDFDETWSAYVYSSGGVFLSDKSDRETRNAALKSAIESANEIYNSKN